MDFDRRKETISVYPLNDAMYNGVAFLSVNASIGAPLKTRLFTKHKFPFLHAL